MKKILKISLVVVVCFILCFFIGILIDLFCAFYGSKPLFSVQVSDIKYDGLIYDIYYCPEYTYPKVKSNDCNYMCSGYVYDKDELIETVSSSENKILKEYVVNANTKDEFYVYYYGLSKVTVTLGSERYEFGEAIANGVLEPNYIYSQIKIDVAYKDGGSTMYKDKKNANYKILQCNTVSGNKDIYIGDSRLEYSSKYCKSKDFIRTYNILNIAESNDDDYLYLTVRMYQREEVETVKVSKELAKNVEVDNYYEFTFEYTDKEIKDDIKSIFNNAKLVKIRKTSKRGNDQINDIIEG